MAGWFRWRRANENEWNRAGPSPPGTPDELRDPTRRGRAKERHRDPYDPRDLGVAGQRRMAGASTCSDPPHRCGRVLTPNKERTWKNEDDNENRACGAGRAGRALGCGGPAEPAADRRRRAANVRWREGPEPGEKRGWQPVAAGETPRGVRTPNRGRDPDANRGPGRNRAGSQRPSRDRSQVCSGDRSVAARRLRGRTRLQRRCPGRARAGGVRTHWCGSTRRWRLGRLPTEATIRSWKPRGGTMRHGRRTDDRLRGKSGTCKLPSGACSIRIRPPAGGAGNTCWRCSSGASRRARRATARRVRRTARRVQARSGARRAVSFTRTRTTGSCRVCAPGPAPTRTCGNGAAAAAPPGICFRTGGGSRFPPPNRTPPPARRFSTDGVGERSVAAAETPHLLGWEGSSNARVVRAACQGTGMAHLQRWWGSPRPYGDTPPAARTGLRRDDGARQGYRRRRR